MSRRRHAPSPHQRTDRPVTKVGVISLALLAGLLAYSLSGCADSGLPAVTAAYAGTPAFSPTVAWNVPVAGQAVDPRSATLVGQLWCGTGCGHRDGAEAITLTTHDWSFPVYYLHGAADYGPGATGTCPVTVRHTNWGSNAFSVPCNATWRPSGVVDWPLPNADGDRRDRDAQMIILDPDTGREWDLWQVASANGQITAGTSYLVPGDYRTGDGAWPPSRGSGIADLAMLALPGEVRDGVVRHALTLLTPVEGTTFVAPATKTDGAVAGGIPSGTRFALRASDADLDAWLAALPTCIPAAGRAGLRTLAVAMRDYGFVVSDHAGTTHVQLADEANPAIKTAWAGLGLGTRTCANGKVYPRAALDGLVTRARLVALAPR